MKIFTFGLVSSARKTLTLIALLSTFSFSQSYAYTLDDNYIGTNHGGWGDVVGSSNTFDLHGFNIQLTGSVLTVDIYTNYAGLADNKMYADMTNTTYGLGNGIGYGDLLISNSADSFTHGFALDNRWSALGGTGTLFATNDSFLSSDDFVETGHRHGYDIAVDTTGASKLNNGTWSVNESGGYLSMQMDLGSSGLLNSDDLYFSWGYTCANDMLIGGVAIADIGGETKDVPEPGLLGLVGLGMLGTLLTRRKKRVKAC